MNPLSDEELPEFAMIMSEDFREHLESIPKEDLESALLPDLVERGLVSTQEIRLRLQRMCKATGARIQTAFITVTPEKTEFAQEQLFGFLRRCFEKIVHQKCTKVGWDEIEKSLRSVPGKLRSLPKISEWAFESGAIALLIETGRKIEFAQKNKELSPEEQEQLLGILRVRFRANRRIHPRVRWSEVEKSLRVTPEKLWSLQQLESTGGEPDVIAEENDEFVFGDCSAESPSGRRWIAYDVNDQIFYKKYQPRKKCNGNAIEMAVEYGVDLMDEEQYRALQRKLVLDVKTSSYLKKPHGDILDGCCYAYRDGDEIEVHRDAGFPEKGRAFRAVLKVKKV